MQHVLTLSALVLHHCSNKLILHHNSAIQYYALYSIMLHIASEEHWQAECQFLKQTDEQILICKSTFQF